jgi:conjugal transfer pilus assembly protein TraW
MRSSEVRSRSVRHGRTALVATAMLFSFAAHAQDLGVIGPVYPIAETSLLELILAKLREAETSGVLARLQRDTQAKVRRGIEEPAPVAGISKTTKARSFYYDPSIVVPYAIADAEGRVIVAPGTKVNPLDTVSLSKTLLFIDARDAAQVGRAKEILDQREGKLKVILTGGSYLDLMRRWKRPVFFDQQGMLTDTLGIRHVPALVSQEGRRLRIDELL